MTTNNLLGVTMVLMDGTVVTLGGPWGEPAGLDLLGVVCGSEGQLGLVTEAWLRILPKPEGARPVMMGFTSNEVAGACVADIIKAASCPSRSSSWTGPASAPARISPMRDTRLRGAADHRGRGECGRDRRAAGRDQADRAAHDPVALEEAQDEAHAKRIWLGRKSAFGAMGQINDYMCLDGTIPVSACRRCCAGSANCRRTMGWTWRTCSTRDGNMHPLILFDANKPGDLEKCEAMGADILRLCVEVGGCLTGEHGVGIEKRDLMGVQYAPADLEAQMRVKDVFDPKWLLNPAKVFPLGVSAGRRARVTGRRGFCTPGPPQDI